MSQDFSVLLHTPTDGTDGDCTASLKNPRGIEPRRILPQPRGSQAHTCMSPQSSDCLTFIHNLKPSDPSIFFRTPHYEAFFIIGKPHILYKFRKIIHMPYLQLYNHIGQNKCNNNKIKNHLITSQEPPLVGPLCLNLPSLTRASRRR